MRTRHVHNVQQMDLVRSSCLTPQILERLNMAVRRNIFVIMISNRFHTMDNMMTFNKSVNLIINTENINDLDKILQRGITDNEFFYRVYRESLKETGKI